MNNQEMSNNEVPMTMTEAILYDYKEGLGDFSREMPGLADHYKNFSAACFEAGALSKKEKQLIALGIAICAQDEMCMVYHTKGCIDEGCTDKEIYEVLGVSAAMGGGLAMSRGVTFVQEACQTLRNQPPEH